MRAELVERAAGLRVVLRHEAEEGEHGEAAVLDLLELPLGKVVLGEAQGVKAWGGGMERVIALSRRSAEGV